MAISYHDDGDSARYPGRCLQILENWGLFHHNAAVGAKLRHGDIFFPAGEFDGDGVAVTAGSGGEDHIAMGSDFDGTDLPEGIGCPSDLMKVAEALAKLNYTDTQLQKLFWQNATQFVEKNLLI